MKSTLIKDTTKSERIALVKQWEEEEGCENSGMNLMEYFRDYIDGKKEIAEVNEIKLDEPIKSGKCLILQKKVSNID